jgi:alpha-amylase
VTRHSSRTRPALLTCSLAAVLVGGVLAATAHAAPAGRTAAVPAAATGDVIANLFEWNWNSIASECTNVLGPDGYGAVQVAPPEESISLPGNNPSHPWWEVYQPVSYQIASRMGNRAQFAAMVTACHNAGVKVYADAVLNHMTGNSGGTGYAGTTFADQFDYPNLYSSNDFHHYPANCPNSNDQVSNYDNQTDVQECELVNLADLYTETDYVRGKLAGYLNDLESLGVDGFRLDAAKHMNDSDIAAIQSRLTRPAFFFQEIMPGGAVAPNQYEGTGSVLEFTYGQRLKAQLQGSIANLQTFGQTWGFEPPGSSVTFVDNHDTDRNGSTLSYKDGATYTLATVFHLAWGYGTPQVYASFTFGNNDQSPPADGNGFVTNTDCGNGAWACTDRAQAVVGMVGWHNAVAGSSVANWWSDGGNAISFSRGSAGFVAIDNEGSALTRTFTTGLPAGTYCDVIHGSGSGGSCTGPSVTVDGSGNASITVQAHDAVAIDVATQGTGTGPGPTTVALTFHETATTFFGQNVFVVGSIPALGNWNPASSIPLSSATYPTWAATVSLPANTTFQYKYIKKNPDGSITWESDPNRGYTTGAGGSATVQDSWR